MAGSNLFVETARIGPGIEALLEAERETARLYQGERLLQFCGGRSLARRLLAAAGGPVVPIGRHETGAPLWPRGYTGSISHSGPMVAVAVGSTQNWAGIGLDIEECGRLESEVWPLLFTPAERATLAEGDADFLSTAFFACKEAFLKLPSPRPGLVNDLHDVAVRCRNGQFILEGTDRTFRRHFGRSLLPVTVTRQGRFVLAMIAVEEVI